MNSNWQLTNNSDIVDEKGRQQQWSGISSLIGVSIGRRYLHVRKMGYFAIISSNNSLFISGQNNAWQDLFLQFSMPKCPWCNMDFISDLRALGTIIHWSLRSSPSW